MAETAILIPSEDSDVPKGLRSSDGYNQPFDSSNIPLTNGGTTHKPKRKRSSNLALANEGADQKPKRKRLRRTRNVSSGRLEAPASTSHAEDNSAPELSKEQTILSLQAKCYQLEELRRSEEDSWSNRYGEAVKSLNELQNRYQCPICMENCIGVFAVWCCHTFCESCVKKEKFWPWRRRCPICRTGSDGEQGGYYPLRLG